MARRVSLARRNLFQDRRRTVLAIGGVAAALVLVLVLEGIFAGSMRQVTAYMRNSPADVFVAQRDVRTMHMSVSVLPADTVATVAGVHGVAWAEGLHYTTSIVDTGTDQRLAYVLGYDTTTGRGGPHRLAAGRAPRSGEALVDDVVARETGIEVGDTAFILGMPFLVSGLSVDGTSLANTTVYLGTDDFVALRGDTVAYILVGAEPGTVASDLAARIEQVVPGTTAQTRAQFAREEANLVRDMAADIMWIMTIIGLLIALAVVGLTLFTTTLAKLREYGVVKALGARPGRLAATVLAQAAWSVLLGLAVAVAAALVVGAAITELTPNVQVVIEPLAIVRTAGGALVIGGLAALLPLGRVMRVDPATAFRRS